MLLVRTREEKILVAEPLYSMETLRERHGFLEFLTSFDEPEIKLLIKRFSECVVVFFFFAFCVFVIWHAREHWFSLVNVYLC
jgi:hypothetical protein